MNTTTSLRRIQTETRRHAIRRERTQRTHRTLAAMKQDPCNCLRCQLNRGEGSALSFADMLRRAVADDSTFAPAAASAPDSESTKH